VKTKNI